MYMYILLLHFASLFLIMSSKPVFFQSWKRPSEVTPESGKLPDTLPVTSARVAMETMHNDTEAKGTGPMKAAELEVFKKRLLALEKNIERRYFQPPFAKR